MDCPRCASPVAADALACDHCHALIHGAEVGQLTAEATAAEKDGRFERARGLWRDALSLLPANTTQATWVLQRLQRLEGLADTPATEETSAGGAGAPASSSASWVKRLGPIGAVLIALSKGKALFALIKLKSVLTLFA